MLGAANAQQKRGAALRPFFSCHLRFDSTLRCLFSFLGLLWPKRAFGPISQWRGLELQPVGHSPEIREARAQDFVQSSCINLVAKLP